MNPDLSCYAAGAALRWYVVLVSLHLSLLFYIRFTNVFGLPLKGTAYFFLTCDLWATIKLRLLRQVRLYSSPKTVYGQRYPCLALVVLD